ncbi:MAG: M48 family metalloprotease, partial [Gemmatimonas sp.]
MKRYVMACAAVLVAALAVEPIRHTCAAQNAKVRTALGGFNLFSTEQDIQIGRQSAVAAERQMALLGVPGADRYVNQIVERLRPCAPGAKYPYAAKIVNAPDINAFALPGGPLYLNRGLIEATRSEAELAGVIAHEMAHIALRHGTTSASNAYLGKTGLGLLGGLVGKRGTTSANIISVVGGMGLNATFLKFSRDDEHAADGVGADMMARAGYSPLAMADFFAVLRQEAGRDPSTVEMFFGSHPPAVERESRVRQLAGTLPIAQSSDIGQHQQLRTMMAAKTMASTRSGIWPAPVSTPNPPVSAPATPS